MHELPSSNATPTAVWEAYEEAKSAFDNAREAIISTNMDFQLQNMTFANMEAEVLAVKKKAIFYGF